MPRTTSTTCPAWALRAWPPLLWQAGCENLLQLRHAETRVTQAGDRVACSAGQTIWVGLAGSAEAGLAWDWIRLSRGIVALADPLSVVTNLRLLGPDGEVLSLCETMIRLNLMVNGLPWQSEVERALREGLAAAAAFG